MREWLRYERMIRAERGRISRRRQRGGGPTGARRGHRAPAPRWLITLDLIIGAFFMLGRMGAAGWLGILLAAFTVFALLIVLATAWKIILLAVATVLAIRAAASIIRAYLAYCAARDEVPF